MEKNNKFGKTALSKNNVARFKKAILTDDVVVRGSKSNEMRDYKIHLHWGEILENIPAGLAVRREDGIYLISMEDENIEKLEGVAFRLGEGVKIK
jgi:hypothetical protein